MAPNCNPLVALIWAPSRRRNQGRLKETWIRTVERECNVIRLTSWAAALRLLQRKGINGGPIPHPGKGID